MVDRVLDVLAVVVDKILYCRVFANGFGVRRSPESESFFQTMATWEKELLGQRKAKQNLTPGEERALKAAKEISGMDDVEFDTRTAWQTKDELQQDKAKGNLRFRDRAKLKLLAKFFDEKNEEKKVKLFEELRKRSL